MREEKHCYSCQEHGTLQRESKTISIYYQGKSVILSLTLNVHPRTFHSLFELPFANQGYRDFVFTFKAIASLLPGTGIFLPEIHVMSDLQPGITVPNISRSLL